MKINPDAIDAKDKIIVTGFHGIGTTGYWAIKYLIEKLNAKRIGIIDSEQLAPVSICRSGKLLTPCEIYEANNIIFLRAESFPQNINELSFFRELAEWITTSGFKELIMIGGLDSALKTDDTTFRLVTTSKFEAKGVLNDAIKLEDDRLIVGPVALLLNYSEVVDFPASAILSYAATGRLDPRGAANALNVLSKILDLTIDVEPLVKEAELLELEVAGTKSEIERSINDNIYT